MDYLRKSRAGRYYVRVFLPKPLQSGKGKKALERYLGTGDFLVAKQRAPAAVAELRARIERMLEGRPPDAAELRAVAVAEMHALHNALDSEEAFNDYLHQIGDDD